MPNAKAHAVGAAIGVGASVAAHQYAKNGRVDGTAFGAAGIAAALGSLPDWIEPAIHPNHRGFFHSISFLLAIGYGLHKLYGWETADEFELLVKRLGLVVGGAVAVHLLMDATTKRSLPLY